MTHDPFAPRYFDRDGNEITDMHEVGRLLADRDRRRVAFDNIDEHACVSTVLLVLDHSFDHDPPLIFETMTFVDDVAEDDCERTSNEHAALAAHDRAVAALRERRGVTR